MQVSKSILLLLTLSGGLGQMQAQSVADTLFLHRKHPQTHIEKFRSTPFYQISKSAIPLFAASALATTIDGRIKETRDFHLSSFQNQFDDYLRYAPMAVTYGMKIGGIDGRSTWPEMLTAHTFSLATMGIVVTGMKYSIKRMRPDLSKRNSFPSGHSAEAFMSATMLYKEYGELSPWVGIGAYGTASVVAVSRILNNRHWMSDVLFGAGVGIMSTELGYYLSDLIFKKKKAQPFFNRDIDYTEIPSYLEYSIAYSCLFPQVLSIDGKRVHAYSGIQTSLAGAHFFANGWGVGGSTSILSAKLTQDFGTIGSATFALGPEYSACLCPRLFWNAHCRLGISTLLYNQDIEKRGFSAQGGVSLLGQISPTMGLRAFVDYTYTTLSAGPVYKDLNFLSVGLSASALF